MGRSKKLRFILLSLFLVLNHPAFAASWVSALITNPTGGNVHFETSEAAEVLGNYPAGTFINVYDHPTNGFYSVYLKTPVRGTHYVWISQQDVQLKTPERKPQGQETKDKSKSKNWSLEPKLGFSNYIYQQTGLGTSFAMSSLTGQVSFNWRPLPPPFEFGAEVSHTLLPLSTSMSGTSAQFMKIILKGGVGLDFGKIHLDLFAGAYLNSMTVRQNAFGYSPFVFAGLIPELAWDLGNRYTALGVIRLFPSLASQNSPLEVDLGAGLAWKMNPDHRLSASLTFSSLGWGTLSTNGISLQTLVFDVGYTF